MKVVVTRPAAEAGEWVHDLRARGVDAIALPLIEIRPVADRQPLVREWQRLAIYRAAMFVSANAVRGFFAARPGEASFAVRAWATGNGTRQALLAAGVDERAIDSPPADAARFDSEALWSVVERQCRPGDRVLFVRGAEGDDAAPAGRDWLEQRLVACGVAAHAVPAYVRAAPSWSDAERAQAAFLDREAWLFSSSQAIENLREALPRHSWQGALAIATHPRIARAAQHAGFGVVRESRPGLADVIDVIGVLESRG